MATALVHRLHDDDRRLPSIERDQRLAEARAEVRSLRAENALLRQIVTGEIGYFADYGGELRLCLDVNICDQCGERYITENTETAEVPEGINKLALMCSLEEIKVLEGTEPVNGMPSYCAGCAEEF